MPKIHRPGKTGVYVELENDLLARVRGFANSRNEKFNRVLTEALQRHLAYPPAILPELPPLPFPIDKATNKRPAAKRTISKKVKRTN
jgi:hypothetical protein